MKKIVIAGSRKLHEQIAYWRGYFEGRGFEVLDWPVPTPESNYSANMTKIYQHFYQSIDDAHTFFLMNEDRNGVEGYIGPSAFSELTYAVINNLNHGKKIDIQILKVPAVSQGCYEEIKFWIDQKWIRVFDKDSYQVSSAKIDTNINSETASGAESLPSLRTPSKVFQNNDSGSEKTLDITTCHKRCLQPLTDEAREYLRILSPDFPAWLLKYIAVPEFQRLSGVSMTTMDYSSLYSFPDFNSTFCHSIGAALIVWHFTHDKRQTIAALYHDIASPAFKHAIDYLNNDSEKQESIEAQTGDIIRGSRNIMKLLKRDGIMSSEVTDYKIYPIADNETPRLAADRLEYTFSNGFFCYETWDLATIRTIYENITILENEDNNLELGFTDQDICERFVKDTLPVFISYSNEKTRASLQFIADIVGSMMARGRLTMNDLYTMSEREVIEWILSCGEKEISDAFREFQRATTVFTSNTIKKKQYCTDIKSKVRYTTPLVRSNSEAPAKRIDELSDDFRKELKKYLDTKQPKYVGFEFDFTPIAPEEPEEE